MYGSGTYRTCGIFNARSGVDICSRAKVNHLSWLETYSETTVETKPSNLELTARVVLPSLTLIAFAVTNLFNKWPRLSWVLIAFGICFSVLSYYSTLKRWFIKWKASWDDRRVARRAFPELLVLVQRFGPFVNRGTSDTLHYIVESDIYQGRADLRADCQLPNIDIWFAQWQYLAERLDRQPKSMRELRPALMEFHFLVGGWPRLNSVKRLWVAHSCGFLQEWGLSLVPFLFSSFHLLLSKQARDHAGEHVVPRMRQDSRPQAFSPLR
jgi:hypothetical protein